MAIGERPPIEFSEEALEVFAKHNEILADMSWRTVDDDLGEPTTDPEWRLGLPTVQWCQIVMSPRPVWHRFRYWLGDQLERLAWLCRDGI